MIKSIITCGIYILLSCTTAWKNPRTKTRAGNAGCGHSARAVAGILRYVPRRFSFRPLGGSVTTYQKKVRG